MDTLSGAPVMTAVLSVIALAIAVAASWSLLQSGDPWRAWRRFAQRGGLSVVVPMPDGDPQLSGTWRGIKVRVVCAQADGLTRFQARVPAALPCALTVRPRADGGGEPPDGATASGDADLDGRFVFRSGEPAALAALLADAEVRAELSALSTRHPAALLEDGVLRFAVPGRVMDPDALEDGLEALVAPLVAMLSAAGAAGTDDAPPEPPVEVLPAAVIADADAALLARLAAPTISAPERRLTLDALGEGLQFFTVAVERVAPTAALVLDEAYRGGRTLYAAAGALKLSVRFPSARDADLDDLRPGETLRVRARVEGWDGLTRRLALEAP